MSDCELRYEKCRTRSSIHQTASTIIFFIAAISLLFIAPVTIHHNLMKITKEESLLKMLSQFFRFIYMPFFAILIFHLIRIYLSFLVMDEDPKFYNNTLRNLSYGQRAAEYFMRFIIFIWLSFSIGHLGIVSFMNKGILVCGTYYWPIPLLYAMLLLWDFLMLYFTGPLQLLISWKHNFTRISFLLNDILGLIMSLIIIKIEKDLLGFSNIIGWVIAMLILVLAALASLLVDLFINRRENYINYKSHLLSLIKYIRFECRRDNCLSARGCPHA